MAASEIDLRIFDDAGGQPLPRMGKLALARRMVEIGLRLPASR